jgi:hypothetical protein
MAQQQQQPFASPLSPSFGQNVASRMAAINGQGIDSARTGNMTSKKSLSHRNVSNDDRAKSDQARALLNDLMLIVAVLWNLESGIARQIEWGPLLHPRPDFCSVFLRRI